MEPHLLRCAKETPLSSERGVYQAWRKVLRSSPSNGRDTPGVLVTATLSGLKQIIVPRNARKWAIFRRPI